MLSPFLTVILTVMQARLAGNSTYYLSPNYLFSSKHAIHCFRKLKQYSSIDPREIFPAGYSIYQTFCILFRNNANVIELILLTDRKLQKKVLSKE